jgi:hypothetical protein
MTKRVITTWVAILLGFLAAAPAHAEIGSVISSFDISYTGYGILAQGNYVYLSDQVLTYGNYILTYTHSGTLLRSSLIDPGNQYPLYSGSRTHLGTGYMALLDYYNTNSYLKIFSISGGGSPVASFRISTSYPWNCFWDGEYYYVSAYADRNIFRRFSRSGVYSGTWTCAGWPASMTYCRGAEYAKRGNYGSGPYFVAGAGSPSRPYCMTTFPGGSLVRTWTLPGTYLTNMSYGDSSNPGVYGAAIWATTNSYKVWEIDIDARGASSVVPASIGKLKAIYR